MDLNSNIIEKYDSITDTMTMTINNYTFDASIISCYKNKKNSFNGFIWKHVVT